MSEEQTAPVAQTENDGPASPSTETTAGTAAPSDAAEHEEHASAPAPQPLGPNPNAELDRIVFESLKTGAKFDPEQALALLDVTIDEFNALVESYPNMNFGSGEQGAKWYNSLETAQGHLLRGRALAGALARENSLWRQIITHGTDKLFAGRPKLGEKSEGGNLLTGERAMMKMQAVLGLGAIVRVPLWHTGIWVSVKAPSEQALLQLERMVANEKITLGRQSNGLIFSSTSVYTVTHLINFVLDHVYDVTYKVEEMAELKKVIRTTDIPTLLWGMLCAIYPMGYNYHKACVINPEKCQHVTEELINLTKISWTDERHLTEKQRRHMTRMTAKFTAAELEAYQADHAFQQHAVVKLHPDLLMALKVPTIEEFQLSGYRWVDSIVRQADRVFAGTLAGEERNQYLIQQGQVTALRQYAHWIDKLVLIDSDKDYTAEKPWDDSDEQIVDRQTIEDTVAQLAANDDVFKAFFEGVGTFIDNSTISLIAIPKYNCPNCGEAMTDEEKKHPHLIALDTTSLFFTLTDQRINKVLSRSLPSS